MAIFHPFLGLPLELRIQIWENSAVENRILRILRVRKLGARPRYWSPNQVPGITRACRESRKYCSYIKMFADEGYPSCIWTDFKSDIIQMTGSLMHDLMTGPRLEKNEVRRLRVQLAHDNGMDESESFFHDYSHKIRKFPKLRSCSILVYDGLYKWVRFIREMYWGVCPVENVQIIDAKTGEWIVVTTSGAYGDYFDTSHGTTRNFTILNPAWDWDDESLEERYEAMMAIMRDPLPRLELV